MNKQQKKIAFKDKVQLNNPIHFLAVGLGSGMAPFMPGTFGSLAAIPLWFAFFYFSPIFYWLLMIAAFVFGCYICQKTSDDTATQDAGNIVWDEFVGMWITLFFIPYVTWYWLFIAFVLFRLFDIIKPWPISWFDQKVSGGLGIMIDDVIAAIFAAAVIVVLSFYL